MKKNFILILAALPFLLMSCVEFDNQERSYTFSQDFLNKDLPESTRLVRIGEVERQNGILYRWGIGPESIIVFAIPWERTLKLELAISSPIENLGIEVTYNGKTLKRMMCTASDIASSHRENVVFQAEPGVNVISLLYSNYNNKETNFLGDTRALAVRVTGLMLAENERRP